MASSYVVAGGCACTRVFSRNGKLSSRAYCLLLLVVVVLCTQLSAAQSYGCDGVDGLCINDTSVDFNRLFFQVPRIYIELGGVGNESLQVTVDVPDAVDKNRCLPFGTPSITATVDAASNVTLPHDVPGMIYVFLNCTYLVTITQGGSEPLNTSIHVGLPGFINNYTPRAIVDITLREGSNMFEAEWLDLDPVWILEGYEVVFFRGENVIPEKVFVVPVTEILRDERHHRVAYETDIQIPYTVWIYPIGFPRSNVGGITVRTTHGQLTFVNQSPVTNFVASAIDPQTNGDVPRLELSWQLNLPPSANLSSPLITLAVSSMDRSVRCVPPKRWLVVEYPSDTTSLRFPEDFPEYDLPRVQYGCDYNFQIQMTTSEALFQSEVVTVTSSPKANGMAVKALDPSPFKLMASTPRIVENISGKLSLEVNASWEYPALTGAFLSTYIFQYNLHLYDCSNIGGNERNFLALTLNSNDSVGQRHYAILRVDNVIAPWCVRASVSAAVYEDPLLRRNAFPTRRMELTFESPENPTEDLSTQRFDTDLSTQDNTATRGGLQTPIIIAIVIAALVALALLACLFLCLQRREAKTLTFEFPSDEKMFDEVFENKHVLMEKDLENMEWVDSPKHVDLDSEIDPEATDIMTQIDVIDTRKKVEELGEMSAQTQMDILSHNLHMHGYNVEVGSSLGTGEFGHVFKAQLTDCDKVVTDVAIKTLHAKATSAELKLFHSEINIMKDMEPHENVIMMLGCCEDGLTSSCLIVEYMPYGNLQDFLRDAREVKASSLRSDDPYHNVPDPKVPLKVEISSRGCLGLRDTFLFARQIASAMEHLEKLRLVHRDLAARNVLLGDDKLVKISDFGLAKDVYHDNVPEQEKSSGKSTPMPYKWMAIESLQFNTFSSASDVWSFGIVLWEIIMTGAHPYPTTNNCDMPALLATGYRMEPPPDCATELYMLMLDCWDEVPENRPVFTDISQSLEELQGNLLHYVDLDV